MIIVKLIGGLGNQIFQYALGRNLAEKNKAELKLDVSGFETYKKHKYSLNHFNIIENIATAQEVSRYKKYDAQTKIGKLFNLIESLKPLKSRTYIKEPHYYGYFPKILNLKGGIYLDGFWQSEKYFKDIENILRDEFTIKEKLEDNLLNAIISTNSVSIHVRRTDYVTNPGANKIHGVCGLDYYNNAIVKITNLVKTPHFFVFSDDIEWSKNNIKINFPITFVEHGADKNYEDLTLMSLCKHNIIANSSFSWWGAWLNNNPNKIVIAPKKWLNNNKIDKRRMVIESWIKI